MLTPAELWKLIHLNRKQRRAMASPRFNRPPYEHRSKYQMGIVKNLQRRPSPKKG